MATLGEVQKSYDEAIGRLLSDKNAFAEYLKFGGRFFKLPSAQAISIFAANPDAKMVADYDTWQRFDRQVKRGAAGIPVISEGKVKHYFDISATVGKKVPYQWTVDKEVAESYIKRLSEEENKQFHKFAGCINFLSDRAAESVAEQAAEALGIAENDRKTFAVSLASMVRYTVAARCEWGGHYKYGSPALDLSALDFLKGKEDLERLTEYVRSSAKSALIRMEKSINNIISERSIENERGNKADLVRGGQEILPRNEGDRRQDVQARPREVRVSSGSDDRIHAGRGRADVAADRTLGQSVADVHGRELPGGYRDAPRAAVVVDNPASGGQRGTGDVGRTGGTIRKSTPSSDNNIHGDSAMGEHQTRGDNTHGYGGSSAEIQGTVTEKIGGINSTKDETEKAEDITPAFFVYDKLRERAINSTDEEQLVDLTREISAKKMEVTALTQAENYSRAREILDELTALREKTEALKVKIAAREITKSDVDTLRGITPARKSVQNLLDEEVARTPKFERLLGEEMGAKSAYEMRRNGNDWRNDESKTVPVIEVEKRTLPKNISTLRRKESIAEFSRGTFINQDTGLSIIFGRKSITETIAKTVQDSQRNRPVEARINALYHMQELLENAICFDSEISEYDPITSKNKSPNSLFMHKLYGVFTYDGQPYLASLAVEAFYSKDDKRDVGDIENKVYNFKDIKITPMKPGFDPRDQLLDESNGYVSLGAIAPPIKPCQIKQHSK